MGLCSNRFGPRRQCGGGVGELKGETRHNVMRGQVRFAVSVFDRLRGLFAHPHYYGLLILVPCRSIHTYGMKEAIQVAFISKEGMVLEADSYVAPGAVLGRKDAVAVIERRISGKESPKRRHEWFQTGDIVSLDAAFEKGLNND